MSLTKKEKEKLSTKKDPEYPNKENIINWVIKKQQHLSIGEISRRLDRSKETVVKLISALNESGYDIHLDKDTNTIGEIKSNVFKPSLTKIKYKKFMKIGLISDTHLGSTYQQLSLLHDAYKVMEKEEVAYCIHAGDWSDGPVEMHKRPEEVFIKDADGIIEYGIKNYPKTDKFKTYILDEGTHDTFWKRFHGINVVKHVCQERDDLILRRGDNSQFVLEGSENVLVHVIHPTGGISYARSYRQQKMIDGIMSEFLEHLRRYGILTDLPQDQQLPHLFVSGHFHVYNNVYIGGVESFSLPCFQGKTRYLRAKGLNPDVGFIIVTLHFDQNKVISKITIDPYRWSAYIKKNDY